MIRATRLLNARHLRAQPLRAALAVISVAAGVALAVTILVISASVPASFADAGRRLAGPAPLRVIGATSHGGVDRMTVDAVGRVPGVAVAAPVVQTVTLADPGPDGQAHAQLTVAALGIDCRSASLLGAKGCPPIPGLLVAPRLLALAGRGGLLRTDEGLVPLKNALVIPQLDAVNGGYTAVWPLAEAQRLFARPDAVDVVYVTPAPDVPVALLRQRLLAAIGPWNGVLASTDPPPGVALASGAFLPIFGLLGLFALGTAAMLVFNTMSLSMEERRRDLAVLGALGAPSRTIMFGVLAEGGGLGLVGGAFGALGGILLAHPLLASLSSFAERLAGVRITVHVTPAPVVAGVVLGALVGMAAAAVPGRRALRIDAAAELSGREQRSETAPRLAVGRAVFFSGVAVAGVDLCWIAQRHGALHPWQPRLVGPAILLATCGFVMAGGALAPLLARLAQRATARRAATRGPLMLALSNLVGQPGRTGVMVLAVSAAVGTAFVTASFNVSIGDGITTGMTAAFGNRVHASTLPATNSINLDGRPSPAVLHALAGLPGVAGIDMSAGLLTGHQDAKLVGVEANDHANLRAFPLLDGSRDEAAFARGMAMIGPALARRRSLHPGSLLRLETPRGFADVPVLGIWQYGDFNGSSATLPMNLVVQLYGPQSPLSVAVRPAAGVSAADLVARIQAAHLDPDLLARTPRQEAAATSHDVRQQIEPFWAIQRGLLLVAFIAVVSTLLLAGVQRRREFGLLAAVGMRPSELGRMVLAEAGLVGVIGVVVGTALAVGMYVAMFFVVPILIPFHDPFRLDFSSVAVYGPISLVVVVAGALWPAWRTARIDVLPALQYE